MRFVKQTCRAVSLLIVAGAIATPASAQDSASKKGEGGLCWRGRPAPSCKSIVLTEFGYNQDVVKTSVTKNSAQLGYDNKVRETWDLQAELGLLRNITAKNALGASTFLRVGNGPGDHNSHPSAGVKARYRRWLTPDGLALDVGAGVRFFERDHANYSTRGVPGATQPSRPMVPNLTTDLALNFKDYGALVVRADAVKYGDRYRPKVSFGVRGGSRVGTIGLAATGTTALLVGLLIRSWLSGAST